MAANHTIDHENQLIITRWTGEPRDDELLRALKKYNKEITNKKELNTYNELVVFESLEGVRLSTNGLKMLVKNAEQFDRPGVHTKLAFVVTTKLAYGLARMYTIYRSLNPKHSKKIQVFKNKTSAMGWLTERN